jgi:peptidoglycan/LPS O-acetylase OafA/YrhL
MSGNHSFVTSERRVAALDGLRGVLAVVILAWHVVYYFGVDWMLFPALFAVVCFFVMSGYVLTRSWTGRFFSFLLRRFIRLWPVYAVCLIAGYIIAGKQPIWTEFFWYPFLGPNDPRSVDPPMWSLIVEAWAMPLMPLIVWAGTASALRAALVLLAVIVLGIFHAPAFLPLPFIAGAFLSKADFNNQWLESSVPQWLGKISYSLYLSHVLVLTIFVRFIGLWGSVIAIPFVFAVAWAIWFGVENPSIWLSRRAGSCVHLAPRMRRLEPSGIGVVGVSNAKLNDNHD